MNKGDWGEEGDGSENWRYGRFMILAAPVDKNVTNFSKKPEDRYLVKLDFILLVYCGPHES